MIDVAELLDVVDVPEPVTTTSPSRSGFGGEREVLRLRAGAERDQRGVLPEADRANTETHLLAVTRAAGTISCIARRLVGLRPEAERFNVDGREWERRARLVRDTSGDGG